ncbi:MAG: hypothetical protein AAFN93_27635, partial [Bacteroidota bacterium]
MNFWDAIVLFGVIQGFATAGIILQSNRGNRKSNYLVASLLLILGLTCLNLLIDSLDLHIQYRWIYQINRFFPLLHAILIGPLIYLLVRCEVDRNFTFRNHRVHFLWVIWSFIPHFVELFRTLFRPYEDYSIFIEHFFRYGDIVLWGTS